MTDSTDDIQRTLGRLEGKVDQILSEQVAIREEFAEHKGEDKNNFQAVSSRFGLVTKRLDDADLARQAAWESANEKLNTLNGYVEQVKGAWWLVGVIVTVVAGLGALVAWVVGFWPKGHV